MENVHGATAGGSRISLNWSTGNPGARAMSARTYSQSSGVPGPLVHVEVSLRPRLPVDASEVLHAGVLAPVLR